MLTQGTMITMLFILVILLVFRAVHLSSRLDEAHKKIDLILESFDGLRRYLYEIDPQFDDERESNKDMEDINANPMSSYHDLKLLEQKEAAGRRTLNTPFVP